MTGNARQRRRRSRRGHGGPSILLAPCGFKEGLTVSELIECMARGVKAAAPDAHILRAPMADGGEGFTETLTALAGGRLHPVTVTGPVGQRLRAHVGCLAGRHAGTAVIEIAADRIQFLDRGPRDGAPAFAGGGAEPERDSMPSDDVPF